MKTKKRIAMVPVGILIIIFSLTGCMGYEKEDGKNLYDITSISSAQKKIKEQIDNIEVFREETEYSTEEEIESSGTSENMLAYWKVLNSTKPFISANEGCQEFYWDEYYWCLSEPDTMFTIYHFGIVDLDNDGIEEMVLVGFPETTQILDYQDGKVYSYQFVFRGMSGIAVNGVYHSASAADIGGFHRIHLDKGTYEEETLAYMAGDYFEVEGVEVSADEFWAYTEPFTETEMMESVDFTEEMLEQILLGEMGEEELAITKYAEREEICEENNPQQANVPESYLTVLTGNETFICSTEGGQELVVNGNSIQDSERKELYQILYLSIVDMDKDGEDEVVLTCDSSNLILHATKDGVYGYVYAFWDEMGVIDKEGVFRMGHADENKYGKIVSFETDGCQIEPVENYKSGSHDRVRYYFFSEETMAQRLEKEKKY